MIPNIELIQQVRELKEPVESSSIGYGLLQSLKD